MGILICGLNGSGKSTLGRALANELGYTFIDNEDLFFPKVDASYLFSEPRSRSEVERMLAELLDVHPQFLFAAVRGDYGEAVVKHYSLAVVVEVPREVRLKRVYDRSYARFGARMEPGGDLYEQEKSFLDMVSSRNHSYVTDWTKQLRCPVLFVDGTRPIAENVAYIKAAMGGIRPYVAEQLRLHPSITPQDLAKLCYQAARGAEHLLSDPDSARWYLAHEMEATEASKEIPLYEAISPDMTRVNLAAWKSCGLTADDLFPLFLATASASPEGEDRLPDYLAQVSSLMADGAFSVSSRDWEAFLARYKNMGMPAVHHSDAYRRAERPAYRIVHAELLREFLHSRGPLT